MELNARVGQRLRELREERGLTLSALARRSGTGKATLSELEAGRRNPTLETLYALTTALGVPVSAVLAGPGGLPHEAAQGGPAGPPRATAPPGISGRAVTAVLTERYEDGDAVTDVFRIRIRAGAVQQSPAHIAGAHEHLLVLGGTAVVGDPAAPLTAGPGGHAAWAADRPHVYSAPHGDVEGILLVRYPQPGEAAEEPAG